MSQRSLILLKPDLLARGLERELLKWVHEAGLVIVRAEHLVLDQWTILDLYPCYDTLRRWMKGRQYLEGKLVKVWEVVGDDAVEKTNDLKRSFRLAFLLQDDDRWHTLIHTPDTEQDFLREHEILTRQCLTRTLPVR